jgi:hypothetical protein
MNEEESFASDGREYELETTLVADSIWHLFGAPPPRP